MEAKKFAPMLTRQQALDQLLAAAIPLQDSETIDTLAANGRVLAVAQVSQLNVPSFDNSQMDGYALCAADCQTSGSRLRIAGRIPAGQVGQLLAAGCAARIFTGAGLPPGADCVVMQEACVVDGDFVIINHCPKPGEWVRRTGEDIKAGAVILPPGTRLRAAELGLAASVGLAQLPVLRRLRVAMFFTGDELAMPGETLRPGAIYNSNRFILRGLLENLGCQISDYGIVPDTLEATRAALREAAQAHDLIITSGGVSVGEEDHVKPAVEAEGGLHLWQIAIKPGKPLAFGQVRRAASGAAVGHAMEQGAGQGSDAPATCAFIGLPGNPVSCLITFILFVRPFILRMQAIPDVAPQDYWMRADFDWPKADRRNEFLRAKRNAEGGLDLFANQGSAVLTSTVWGDGIIDNPPGQAIARGDLVRFIPFNELFF
jgi:molybdopterin molybdotransferase